jgi:methyl-accepting chemotaxis protein
LIIDKRGQLILKNKINIAEDGVNSRIDSIKSGLTQSHEIQLFKKITDSLTLFRETRTELIGLIDKGKIAEAMKFVLDVHDPVYIGIRQNILDLEKMLKDDADGIIRQNLIQERNARIELLTIGIAMLAISMIFAFWMIGMLRKISREIKEGVVVLGTSASEILTTVTEVSTGATETATAVSETTTTVEEVRQTAMVANEKAIALAENSHKAADSGEKGRESVRQVIDSMKRIESQMKFIADIIDKLSEQNRTIGEITTSVNDIADQSNLLAVNAAIEAAKAGEQGRGFSVVAQEIRSLAEQSKRATVQVKEMLNDMQRSVNKAVEAIGNGTKAVDEGTRLVAESGSVIDILADNIEDALQSALQISSSSQQQMAGMEQIVPAMGNIKLASEQNVAGIRQTKITANDLNDLSVKLKEIISRFNL